MYHNGSSQRTRKDQEERAVGGQKGNTKEFWAVIRFPYDDLRALSPIIEQICRSGKCIQPVGVYEVSRSPSNKSMGRPGGNGHPPDAADQMIVTDRSDQCVLDGHARTGTLPAALPVVSADNLYLAASEMQTRVTQGSKPAPIPMSAAGVDAAVLLPSDFRILGRKIIDDPRQPLFYIDARGRERPFIALMDTGAEVTVARVSVARRGNACTVKRDCPVRLAAFHGQTVTSKEYAWLDLHRQGSRQRGQPIMVWLLEDRLLPFADAHLGRKDALILGLRWYWE
ncbi:uncharacterized protein Z520_00527 [Fonsecaea multimorphosa CBS 102226]|uniref:Uncharacterized protein n=1 Tax=Fonsecaea multimorphosa CBS 102226 TaxID=1442371 RepID=A0A0D2HPR9_9EURO|nr:uncharacterized protein Z520_00527 [Fonsecaea multimorphosa CBS 102226]KIY03836.1 hypothetical protein Z520_00527 [Fonsecaea multimorphosa CBS 102226]OAL32525.1 hypothetical protein AYO22_00547 [Fonsecaea multimorphosa]